MSVMIPPSLGCPCDALHGQAGREQIAFTYFLLLFC